MDHGRASEDCDLLVIGGGMAGLSAAARASELGARAIVLEKAPEVGGSAVISGGYVWTLPTIDAMRDVDSGGDPQLSRVVVEDFAAGIHWLEGRDVPMSPPVKVLYGGYGRQIDVVAHLAACVATVEAGGGAVARSATVLSLSQGASGRVSGAVFGQGQATFSVDARNTLLATGGFQGNPILRERFLGSFSRRALVRSNPHSTGDGLTLALGIGAAAVDNDGFCGHLVCSPVEFGDPDKYRLYTQYHSPHCVLLNVEGQRFVDESLGEHVEAQAIARQPDGRGVLIWDEAVHARYALQEHIKGDGSYDRFDIARASGARAVKFDDIDALARRLEAWGFDGREAVGTLRRFNDHLCGHAPSLSPPRRANANVLQTPPFRALEVRPSITFTYGGLAADSAARVLTPEREPVPSLLVAGADVGNVYRYGYGGGLALALTFGLRAARTACV